MTTKFMQMNSKITKVSHIAYMAMTVAAFATGCTDKYAEINTNPYAPTRDQLLTDGYNVGRHYPAMVNAVIPAGDVDGGTDYVNSYQVAFNLAADCFSGFMGQANNWNGNTNNLTYGFNLDWVNQQFQLSGKLMAAWQEIKTETLANNDSLSFAVAQVIKITGLARATDNYGPIPYRDIETGTFTPRYEPQDSIYYSFFEELDVAIRLLHDQGSVAGDLLKRFDQIYGGNYTKWARYANSLKLRLAMRICYVAPQLAQRHFEAAVGHPAGLLTVSADDDALQKANGSGFPFYNPLAVLTDRYDEARMGASIQSFLEGYGDPRRDVFFTPASLAGAAHPYAGVRSGIEVTPALYQPYSKLKVTKDTPMPWMRTSEVCFLLAEGAIRGWNTRGKTAGELYTEGIMAAFKEANVSMPSGYLEDGTSIPRPYTDPASSQYSINPLTSITIKWDDAASFETKLERIITQKWLGLYPNGQEAWTEYRRTGYPKIFPVAINRSGGTVNTALQVRRLPYPRAQYQQNGEQTNRALSLLGGPDNGGTKVWWDKKN